MTLPAMQTDSAGGGTPTQLSTGRAAHVYDTTITPGQSSLTDMTVGGIVWKRTRVTATGAVAGLAAGNVVGGFIVQTSTSLTITAYDAASAVANDLLVPVTAALTVGQVVSIFGGGVGPVTVSNMPSAGTVLVTGLYLTLGGTGSVWVLYR